MGVHDWSTFNSGWEWVRRADKQISRPHSDTQPVTIIWRLSLSLSPGRCDLKDSK